MTSPDDIARAIISEGQTARTTGNSEVLHGVITTRGIQIALATALVETNDRDLANPADPESENFPNDGDGYDHLSDGEFQQQPPWWGTVAERMDPHLAAAMFYNHLEKLNYNDPNTSPGTFAQDVQGSAYPDRYDQRFQDAVDQYNRLAGSAAPAPVSNAPAYHESQDWSPNEQSRNGQTPTLWLIHTEEAPGNADDLAGFLDNPASQVSYHYTIDNRVQLDDIVPLDEASWSVLDANNYSINLCFAGSSVNLSRQEWLDQYGNAIDVAAYLAVRDCRQFGIPIRVIPPPYNSDPPGISDHRYVTEHLGIGTHVDVGDHFPWDVFTAAINKYANGDGFLMALTDEQQQEIYDEITKKGPSRSYLATDASLIETLLGFIYNIDGNVWNIINVPAYLLDVPSAVQDIERVASTGVAPESWAGQNESVKEFGVAFCKGLVEFKPKFKALFAAAPVAA